MKINRNKNKNTFSITGITAEELEVMCAVICTADKRCFNQKDENDDVWYSNDDFILKLEDSEREALKKVREQIDNFFEE